MCMYTYNWYFCERSRQGNATRKLDLCLFSGDRMGWSTFFLICAVLVKWWENKEYSIAFGYFYNIHIRIDFLFFFWICFLIFLLWFKSIVTRETKDFLPNNKSSVHAGILNIRLQAFSWKGIFYKFYALFHVTL